MTRYLIFISLVWSCSLNMILRVRYPFTWTCSPKNPTNDPLNGFKSLGLTHSLEKASQYSMSAELPWSTRVLLISHSSYFTVMTMGSSL